MELEPLLRQSDIVSLHVPLMPQTYHLIGTAQLAMMKQGSYLVNTSRGSVLDEKALVKALRSGHLAGAALDVYESEPPDPDNPLFRMDNVVLTPHVGGDRATPWSRRPRPWSPTSSNGFAAILHLTSATLKFGRLHARKANSRIEVNKSKRPNVARPDLNALRDSSLPQVIINGSFGVITDCLLQKTELKTK